MVTIMEELLEQGFTEKQIKKVVDNMFDKKQDNKI